MNLKPFLDYLALEKNYSPHTVTAYHGDLEVFFAFAKAGYEVEEADEINYAIVRTWIVSLVNQEISNRSINRKVSSLKAYYKFLLKTGDMKTSPLSKHKALKTKKKIQVPFSNEEVFEVFEELADATDFEGLRDRLMVELFYGTGMRRSELINLKIVDVDLGNGTLKVLGKRSKERVIPVLPTIVPVIEVYLEARRSTFSSVMIDELMLTNRGVKMYDTFVYRTIKNYFSKVSQKVKKSPHMLRHTFATHLLNNGADMNSVKELLGHASLASTQVYTHNSIATLRKVHDKAHPRNKK